MALTDRAIKNLKATGKFYSQTDGGGLNLTVSSAGNKLWRLAYRFEGRQKTLYFGAYPAVSLKNARGARDKAKELLSQGIDPGTVRQKEKKAEKAFVENTFENVAREWHDDNKARWTEKNAGVILRRMERDLFPHIGTKSITTIEAADILDCARLVSERGALDYAHRLIQYSGYPLDSTTHYYLWTMKSVMAGFILTACCTRR
jgi:hypothetical protein